MKLRFKTFDHLSKFNDVVTKQPLLIAVRNGFTFMIPLVLIGSFALLLLSLPIQPYQDLLTKLWGDEWRNVLLYIRDGTLNSFSLIAVICISYSYARELNELGDYVAPIIVAATSLASLVALSGINKPTFSISHFGVIGIFISLLVAILSTKLFRILASVKRFRIRLLSDGANPNFNSALSLIVPAAVTIASFALANEFLSYYFNISDLQTFISDSLRQVFFSIDSEFLRGILFILLIHILWIFGIHGSNMLEMVAQGIFVPSLHINQGLIAAGLPPSHIFTKAFFDSFVLLGGCGSMLCLVFAILIVGKNKSMAQLTRLSFVPVLFNINELMVFGIPIVLNPIFLVPFLLTPLVLTVISSLVMAFGLVPMTIHPVEWTTPILLSGYISTNSLSGVILQIVNLIVGTLIYAPFVKLSEQVYITQRNTNLRKVTNAYIQSEERGVVSALLARHDSVGSIARSLTSDLEHDLAVGDIALYYQPIVDVKGNIDRVEALLRWKHRSYGYIYPPLVIALAEEAQISNKLGNWILDRACRDIDALRKLGIDLCVCINVSASQLEDEHFVDTLKDTLDRYQLDPDSLEIEVTERLALRVNRRMKDLIGSIGALGVKLSMDDFGMGHSSLMYLKEYEFDTVKLDGALIKELIGNSNCQNIISSIISLGGTLNFRVVAEYVEEKDQRDLLCALGCDLFQGYLFSQAIVFSELIDYIKAQRHAVVQRPKKVIETHAEVKK